MTLQVLFLEFSLSYGRPATCDADGSDVLAHNADRLYLCRHLAGALFERFKSGLSDLVVMAFSVLNHKYWPYADLTQEKPDYLALDVYGANEMSLIIESYNNFFPDVSGKQVHHDDEWTSTGIKRLIVKKSSLMHAYAVQATVGTHAKHVHCAVPSHSACGSHCHALHY